MAAGGNGRADELGRDDDDVVILCRDDDVEAFRGDVRQGRGELRSWEVITAGGTGSWRSVASPNLALGYVEDGGDDGDAAPLRRFEIDVPAGGLQGRRVDHRRQAAPRRWSTTRSSTSNAAVPALVSLAGSDQRPQAIRRHDLVGPERRAAHVDLPHPAGPTSTTRQGSGAGSPRSCCAARRRSSSSRRARAEFDGEVQLSLPFVEPRSGKRLPHRATETRVVAGRGRRVIRRMGSP